MWESLWRRTTLLEVLSCWLLVWSQFSAASGYSYDPTSSLILNQGLSLSKLDYFVVNGSALSVTAFSFLSHASTPNWVHHILGGLAVFWKVSRKEFNDIKHNSSSIEVAQSRYAALLRKRNILTLPDQIACSFELLAFARLDIDAPFLSTDRSEPAVGNARLVQIKIQQNRKDEATGVTVDVKCWYRAMYSNRRGTDSTNSVWPVAIFCPVLLSSAQLCSSILAQYSSGQPIQYALELRSEHLVWTAHLHTVSSQLNRGHSYHHRNGTSARIVIQDALKHDAYPHSSFGSSPNVEAHSESDADFDPIHFGGRDHSRHELNTRQRPLSQQWARGWPGGEEQRHELNTRQQPLSQQGARGWPGGEEQRQEYSMAQQRESSSTSRSQQEGSQPGLQEGVAKGLDDRESRNAAVPGAESPAHRIGLCTVWPYSTSDGAKVRVNQALIFEFLRYYARLGIYILAYDRDGANMNGVFSSDYAKAQLQQQPDVQLLLDEFVLYHNYTIYGLLFPTPPGQHVQGDMSTMRRANFNLFDSDKEATYTHCRFTALRMYGISRVLVVDFDEFIFCKGAGAGGSDATSQRAFIDSTVTRLSNSGFDQILFSKADAVPLSLPSECRTTVENSSHSNSSSLLACLHAELSRASLSLIAATRNRHLTMQYAVMSHVPRWHPSEGANERVSGHRGLQQASPTQARSFIRSELLGESGSEKGRAGGGGGGAGEGEGEEEGGPPPSIFNCFASVDLIQDIPNVKSMHVGYACPFTSMHHACARNRVSYHTYDCICKFKRVTPVCDIVHLSLVPADSKPRGKVKDDMIAAGAGEAEAEAPVDTALDSVTSAHNRGVSTSTSTSSFGGMPSKHLRQSNYIGVPHAEGTADRRRIELRHVVYD